MKTLDPLKKLCCCAITILLFAFTNASFAQTLTSDKSDYPPGSTVTLTGSGFGSSETVTLQVLHNPTGGDDATSDAHQPWDVTSADDGSFSATWTVPADEDELGASLIASADGQSSGGHAEATFTDGNNPGNGSVTVTSNGGCLQETPPQGSGPYNFEVAEGENYTMTISGVTECEGDAITVWIQNSSSGNWSFNAYGGNGTYVGDFTMHSPTCKTSPISYECGENQPFNNSILYDAKGPNGEGSVHLRASVFDGDCVKTGDDTECNTTTCTVSVVSNSDVACPDNCATLTASGGSSYQWQKDGVDIEGATNSMLIVCSAGTYTAVADCGGSGSIDIHKCNCEPISCSVNGPDQVECSSSHTYTVTPSHCSGNPTYSWSVDGDATIPGAANGSSVDVVANSTCSGTYTVTVNVTCNDCNGDASGSECSKVASVSDDTAPVLSGCPKDTSYQCYGDVPAHATVTANDNCSGALTPNFNEQQSNPGSSCNNIITRTWTVEDACGNPASCTQTITVNDNTKPVITTTATNNQNLGCNPTVTPPCFKGTDNCQGNITPNVSSNGPTNVGCAYTQKWTANYSDACGNAAVPVCITYNWSVSNSVSLTAPATLPVCGLAGNKLTATATGSGTVSATTGYTWTLTGTGWLITAGQGTPTITYTAGASGTTGTFKVTITNSCGCTACASVTFGSSCTEGCSYTQGFYGGTGKNCQQVSAAGVNGVIASALSQGSFKVGTTGHSITFGTTEAACLGSHMPSGTTPAQLPAGDKSCATATGSSYLSGGKYADVLLGQVIALGISMRNTSSLKNIVVNGAYVTTYKATACSSGVAVAGTKLVKGPIPASIFTALGSSFTVSQLWTAANNALGNGSTTPSLSNWTSALDIINNAFDGCRILAGFGSSSAGLKADDETVVGGETDNSISSLNIYPNPAVNQVNVTFISASDMNATVDVYNVNGVLVSREVTGTFTTGESSMIQLDASQWSQGVYFVRIIQGDKSAYGKFIIVK